MERLRSACVAVCVAAMVGMPVARAQLLSATVVLGVPLIHQANRLTCLPACAAMVMRFHGSSATHNELWQSLHMWNDGTSFLEIAQAAEARDFDAVVFAASAKDLINLLAHRLPVIVAIERFETKHAIVVAGYDAQTDRFIVLDPTEPAGEECSREHLQSLRSRYADQALVMAPRAFQLMERFPEARQWLQQDRRYRLAELSRTHLGAE